MPDKGTMGMVTRMVLYQVGLDAADAGLEMFSRKFEARDRSG